MDFKEFLNEDLRKTLNSKLRIAPSELQKQYFVINPPMKLLDSQGNFDELTSPTRFKIIKMGRNFLKIKNISFGHMPYEEVSPNAGKVYTIFGNNIDTFLKPPPGGGDTMPSGGIPLGT